MTLSRSPLAFPTLASDLPLVKALGFQITATSPTPNFPPSCPSPPKSRGG